MRDTHHTEARTLVRAAAPRRRRSCLSELHWQRLGATRGSGSASRVSYGWSRDQLEP
jgi:hypothetical protein